MKLIVNADDFGLSKGINYGIVEAHLNGIVTSTTMMITMPEVEHALELSKRAPNLKIGLHLNMTLGKPLTEAHSLIKENGRFYKPKENPNQDLFSEDEIYLEFKAQYDLFCEMVGKRPTHFDSHLYAHQTYPKAEKAIKRLAKEVGLPVRNIQINGFKKVEFLDFFKGNNGVDLNTVIQERLSEMLNHEFAELMVHPAYVDDFLTNKSSYNLPRATELEILTNQKIKDFINKNNITLIGYDDERIREWHE